MRTRPTSAAVALFARKEYILRFVALSLLILACVAFVGLTWYKWTPVRRRADEYFAVNAVSPYHNVKQVGTLDVRDGHRILVPSGNYEGLWTVHLNKWKKAEPSVRGRRVVDLNSRKAYVFNGKQWAHLFDTVFEKPPDLPEHVAKPATLQRKKNKTTWQAPRIELGKLVAPDGAYTVYFPTGSVPVTVIDGVSYSHLALPQGKHRYAVVVQA